LQTEILGKLFCFCAF